MPSLQTLLSFALGHGRALAPRVPPQSRRHQKPDLTLAYGKHPLQQLDLFCAGDGMRPLVVFVHGGAWQFGDKARRLADRKAPFCRAEGWHFASLNFRMVPEVGVAEMAHDVARAVACMISRAQELGVDARRIVLMGHSSGAHLAALVGTDPAYLGAAGLRPSVLAGIIANDGAAYDAREASMGSGWLNRRLIEPAFPPDDPITLAALSPAVHAAAGAGAPPFLLLHAARSHAGHQARLLEAALRSSGTPVERSAFGGRGARGHVMLSRKLGETGFPATETVRGWLRARFAGLV